MHTRSRLGILLGLAVSVSLLAVSAAQAMYVKGHQLAVDEDAGQYAMTGGLNGSWDITKFHVKQTGPVVKVKGWELFDGCVDVARDGSCAGDPTGTLDFRFRYWARFGDDDQVELGTCAHRIVGGSGGLAGTTGFLMMVDIPTGSAPGFKTHYEGEIDPPGFARPSHATKPPRC